MSQSKREEEPVKGDRKQYQEGAVDRAYKIRRLNDAPTDQATIWTTTKSTLKIQIAELELVLAYTDGRRLQSPPAPREEGI